MLENHTEHLIREVLSENKQMYPSCNWAKWEDDVIQTVLNKMPPKYFLSTSDDAERLAYKYDKRLRMDALIKITEAVSEICVEE
ncbi:hypothetical protein Amet_3088 [Alkaliphilus metalliredigens QYMF]|uniref:Late competence development protein ComFB n=1 Tax=Alkaliphilus metalliredigens (strain QYMF) TaxID=293826 RepID=A6TSR0_ALKMQ|nr:late competence development ComFB family protein [Alkaliphilus metalliredigens]ABR49228.1 hypothetical protein Amet_3088 [Alkaliphilus metalliredigens QYMF]